LVFTVTGVHGAINSIARVCVAAATDKAINKQ